MRPLICCALACACALASGTAHAQSASPVSPADSTRPSPAPAADTLGRRLDPVIVTAPGRRAGYAPRRSASATKTDTPLRDVPQAVTVIGRALMADQAMQSMADVLRYVPGVTMGQGEGHRDAPTIRGTSSTSDFFVDGVRDDAQYLRDVYNVERVEALKGSNAMIFGRGGGGGVINRVTKEASWAPVRATTLEGGSHDHRRITADVGRAFGERAALRVNGVLEDSRTFRGTDRERQGINPAATLRLGGATVRMDYEHFADRRTVDRGVPSFGGRPLAAPVTTFFGDPDLSRSRAVVDAAGLTIERGRADGLLLRNRTRLVRYDKFYQNVYPGAVDATGEQVRLGAYSNATDRRNVFNQTDVTWRVAAGPVRQTLLVGAEVGRQATENFRQTGYFGGDSTAIMVPVSQPTVSTPVEFRQSATDADNRVVARVAGVYLQNQLELGRRWQAVAGLRWDRFDLDFRDERTGEELDRRDAVLSPRGGLVFKPVEPVSVYGSYSLSYLPSSGDQFASLDATTRTLEPERFTNREVGLKWDVLPDLAVTAAVYRLDRTNTSAKDPSDPTRTVQTGRTRTTGWEAGIVGDVTDRWQVAGGYASQTARIVSATSSAPAGRTVPLVPRHTLSLWNRLQLTGRFAGGLGVVHQSDVYTSIDNAVTLPGFTRLDAAAYATVRDGLRLQVNVENLLDRRYYPTSHGNDNIMPGATRTVRMSLVATY